VTLEDGVARVTSLSDEGGEGTNHWYKVTLPEGRNREVRRLFEVLGLMVSRLIRIRYGVIAMPPQLKRGQHVELDQGDLQRLLQVAGMGNGGQGGREAGATRSPGEDDQSPQDASDDVDGNGGPSVEEESDEAIDEVDGNRAPPPTAGREGQGQWQGRPGKRRGFGGQGGAPRSGFGGQGGAGPHGPFGGQGGPKQRGGFGGQGGAGPHGGHRGGRRNRGGGNRGGGGPRGGA
jgi:23S rRNA pseudouridine2605 synthase